MTDWFQLECSGTEDGIKSLREEYQALLDADCGLEETHEFLETEDEILAKMPLLEREKIKVYSDASIVVMIAETVAYRGGRPYTARMEAGSPQQRPSIQSAHYSRAKA